LVFFHQSVVERFQTGVLGHDSGILRLKLFHLGLHVVHLDALLVPGVLCGNPVLELASHQLLFWRQMIEVGPLPGRLARHAVIVILNLDFGNGPLQADHCRLG